MTQSYQELLDLYNLTEEFRAELLADIQELEKRLTAQQALWVEQRDKNFKLVETNQALRKELLK